MKLLSWIAFFILLILFCLASSYQESSSESRSVFPLDEQLTDFTILNMDITQFANYSKSGPVKISIDNHSLDLNLERNYLWTGKLKTYLKDGVSENQVYLPEPITLKGYVNGYDSSKVRLTINPDSSWMSGYIAFDDKWYIIEPRSKIKSIDGTTEHYLYTRENAGEMYGTCGTIEEELAHIQISKDNVNFEDSTSTLKIFGHGDFEFYDINPDDWATRMISVFNDVEGIFEDAINVEFEMTGLVTFTSSFAPFNTTNSTNLLTAFREEFREIENPPRHILHILTGKDLDDYIAGIAFPWVVGHCGGYSMARQTAAIGFQADAYNKMVLSAHEIGHNLGARHLASERIPGTDSIVCVSYRTIITSVFWAPCMLDYFSDSNITIMESYDDVLDDHIPPVVSSLINADDRYTASADILLDVVVEDNYFPDLFVFWGRYRLWIKNENAEYEQMECPGELELSIPWSLTDGDGEKIVEISCYDATGNLTEVSDTIMLDQTPPSPVANLHSTSHIMNEYSEDSTIDICWDDAIDSTSGILGYSFFWDQSPDSFPDSIIDVDNITFCTVSPELADGSWYFAICAIDSAGNFGETEWIGPFHIGTPSSVEESDIDLLPNDFTLGQNYPNPFNPSTRIEFSLPRHSFVTIDIYNIAGRKIRNLVSEKLSAGYKAIDWDGKDDIGIYVSSGIYFYRITTDSYDETKKMIIVK